MRVWIMVALLTLVAVHLGAAPIPDDYRSVYVFHGRRSSNLIALSYDDGPNQYITPRLIDLLKRERVPATFFLLGQSVKPNPETTQALIDAGFEIGNHTMTHVDLRKADVATIGEEIGGLQQLLETRHGVLPRLFRPPYGRSDRRVVAEVFKWNMDVIYWSLDTEDWKHDRTAEDIISQIEGKARGGDIILMHDRTEKILQVTEAVIPVLRERGFRFVTISEMLEDLRSHRNSPVPRECEVETPQVEAGEYK